ncbi:MAG: hypothetical protein LUD72_10450 [Bacteroidales bacterium]|nr:hypothetical protein [Bacteroidales bacterium]
MSWVWSRWLACGNLNNSVANAGLSALNGNNALSNSNWNYGSQQSVKKIKWWQHIARRLRKTAAGGLDDRPCPEGKIVSQNRRAGRKTKSLLLTQKEGISEKRL